MANDELTKLEKEEFRLHGQIIAEQYIPKKRQLSTKRSEVVLKINELKRKLKGIEGAEYPKKTLTLIVENRTFISFIVNGTKIEIDENGNVEVVFTPCNHKNTFPISELRLNTSADKRVKFETWTRLLKENITYTGAINCEKCRKNKEKLLTKFRRYNNKPIGRASWVLRRFQ